MRQGWYVVLAVICMGSILFSGCGKKEEAGKQSSTPAQSSPSQATGQTPAQPQSGGQAPSQPQAATVTSPQPQVSSPAPLAGLSADAEKNRQILTQLNQGKEVTAVTADTLKGWLPETVAGMKKTNASAEQNQVMGVSLTTSDADYQGEGDTSARVTITDIGNMTGMMRTAMAGWAAAQYDRKTDTGYEKTGTYGGFKGMEE